MTFLVLSALLSIRCASASSFVRQAVVAKSSFEFEEGLSLGPITIASPFQVEALFDGTLGNEADARAALPRQRQNSKPQNLMVNSDDVNTSCPVLPESLTVLSSMRFPERLGRCAIVGSGSSLRGQGKGPEIDDYDTVIRVNRIATGPITRDLGNATDVFFVNLVDMFKNDSVAVQPMQKVPGYLNTLDAACDFSTGKGCPFKILVMEGKSGEPYILQGESVLHIAYQSTGVHELEHALLPEFKNKYVPTGGIKAFLSASALCDSVTLYGYSGGDSLHGADIHPGNSRHLYEKEHSLLDHFARGDVPHFQRALATTDVQRALLERVACLGKAGRIHYLK